MKFETPYSTKNVFFHLVKRYFFQSLILLIPALGLVSSCHSPRHTSGRSGIIVDAIQGLPYLRPFDAVWILILFVIFYLLMCWMFSFYNRNAHLLVAMEIDEARNRVTFFIKSPFNKTRKEVARFGEVRVNSERWDDDFITSVTNRCYYITRNKIIIAKYHVNPELWNDEQPLDELRKKIGQ